MNTKTKSESVWYEEVDRGLKNLVQRILGDIPVKFTPNRKDGIDNKDNPYSKPSYPYVRIIHLGETFDQKRYDPKDKVISKDTDTKKVRLSKSAKPYNLNYQFEIISNKMGECNDLTRLWNFEVSNRYNLDVVDKSGNPRNSFMTKTVATSIIEGEQNDDKIFRNIYKYTIRVELDERMTYILPLVTEVNLDFD